MTGAGVAVLTSIGMTGAGIGGDCVAAVLAGVGMTGAGVAVFAGGVCVVAVLADVGIGGVCSTAALAVAVIIGRSPGPVFTAFFQAIKANQKQKN